MAMPVMPLISEDTGPPDLCTKRTMYSILVCILQINPCLFNIKCFSYFPVLRGNGSGGGSLNRTEQIRDHKKALTGGFVLICAETTGREDTTVPPAREGSVASS